MFDVLRAKILYCTKTIKKTKYANEMDSRRYENNVGDRFELYEDIEQMSISEHLVPAVVDLTTVSEIVKEGDF